jgi:hypothetical protein
MDTSDCWICRKAKALTGEHAVKKSDLKRIFGRSGAYPEPLQLRSEEGTQDVYNDDSELLRFKTKICGECNHVRTQQHDRAWEALSKAFGNRAPLNPGDEINLTEVFPKETRDQMTRVQLYFVKVFGCAMLDEGLKVDLQTFSDAIINQSCHPDVYLLFCALSGLKLPKYAANSKVSFNGEWASFIYSADPISVNIVARSFGPEMFQAWNPRFVGDKIVIQEL